MEAREKGVLTAREFVFAGPFADFQRAYLKRNPLIRARFNILHTQ